MGDNVEVQNTGHVKQGTCILLFCVVIVALFQRKSRLISRNLLSSGEQLHAMQGVQQAQKGSVVVGGKQMSSPRLFLKKCCFSLKKKISPCHTRLQYPIFMFRLLVASIPLDLLH
jgi:hypothetical protein